MVKSLTINGANKICFRMVIIFSTTLSVSLFMKFSDLKSTANIHTNWAN